MRNSIYIELQYSRKPLPNWCSLHRKLLLAETFSKSPNIYEEIKSFYYLISMT